MTIQEYQIEAQRTCAELPKDLYRQHMLLGIISEVGEIADAFKKEIAYGKVFDRVNLKEEIADVAWYLANWATFNSLQLKDLEYISLFDDDFEEIVVSMCQEAYESEEQVVDWIFEKGELDFMSKAVVLEFIKHRFNSSLDSIGIRKIFTVDESILKESDWFNDEVVGTKHGDFFNKKSINYNKKGKSITSDDLF